MASPQNTDMHAQNTLHNAPYDAPLPLKTETLETPVPVLDTSAPETPVSPAPAQPEPSAPETYARIRPASMPPIRSSAAMITEMLREDIFNQTYPQGSQLPAEEELCTRFGVSRGPVRQATAHLREEGLISSGRGRHSQIIRNTPGTNVATFLDHAYLPYGSTPVLEDLRSYTDASTGHTAITAVYNHVHASGHIIAVETITATLQHAVNISGNDNVDAAIETILDGTYAAHYIASAGCIESVDAAFTTTDTLPKSMQTKSVQDSMSKDGIDVDDTTAHYTLVSATARTHRGDIALESTTLCLTPLRIATHVTVGHTSALQLATDTDRIAQRVQKSDADTIDTDTAQTDTDIAQDSES